MQFAAVIVAAGRGTRMGGEIPKQYQLLGGVPVLRRTVTRFLERPDLARLVVVTAAADAARYARTMAGLADPRLAAPVPGGASRSASVCAGLEALADHLPPEMPVLIHDAARPLLPHWVIDGVLEALMRGVAGAFPVLPVADALWHGRNGRAEQPRERAGLYRAQTPQGFRLGDILAAHRQANEQDAADDVAMARAAGLQVAMTPGAEENLKLTHPEDIARAEAFLGAGMEIRTGSGFDVHRFGAGDHLMLGGVRVPHERGVQAHSDGDVVLHALTDALLGALAEGDIGSWFPPSDPQWKGAASDVFLQAACARLAERGGQILNADCTIICERPKIGPHRDAMRAEIARIAGLDAARVSVKATTSEGLGFPGRGEGIAAMAMVTIRLPGGAP